MIKKDVKMDLRLLKKFTQLLDKPYIARIGILGSDATENREGETNSSIGLKHEFGVRGEGIPKRSFLREPLEENFKSELKYHKNVLTKAVESLDVLKVYQLLGVMGEAVVQEAFATRGFGKWASNSEYTILKKGSDSPLIDTAQLRKSITSDVK